MHRVLFLYLFLSFVTASLAHAQDIAAQVGEALQRHGEKEVHEKIFVHTDRNFYVTGESMMFKIYIADGNTHTPLDLSKIAYIELVTADQSVLQAKVRMQDGAGHGSLFLPASINSGNYIIRAYTRWMRNYDPSFYFSKAITIVNPFKPLEQAVNSAGVSPMYDAQFFPEGGSMLSDVPCKMAFRVVNRSGQGINFRGALMDGEDTLTIFRPLKFGIGHFIFTPSGGKRYAVVLMDSLNRPILKRDLPRADDYGYTMRLTEEDEERLRLEVNLRQASSEIQAVYLVVHTRGSVKLKDSRLLQPGGTSFLIARDALGEGISHITLFDRSKKPVCERLYFKTPESIHRITSTSLQETYAARSKINLDLQVTAESNDHLKTNLSVSVYRLDSLQRLDALTIDSHLLLASDLHGTVESPAYYLQNTPEARAAADNLMLTHGWRRFRWNYVLGDSVRTLKHIPEYHGQIIQGKLSEMATGKPAIGVVAYMSIPGKQFHLAGSRSDREGNIFFEARDFYGSGRMVVQTNFERDSTYKIEVMSPYAEVTENDVVPALVIPENSEAQLVRRSVNMQLQNIFNENIFRAPSDDSVAFYGNPDERYFLDDFTRFPVMEEVLREYVRAVLVRKRKSGFHFMVYDKSRDQAFREDPMVLLDGVPVFDTDRIMTYDPMKVERLDVITSRYFYGPLTFQGIVSYKTYRGDLDGFELDPRALVMDYDGVQVRREFFSPVYETPQQASSTRPDFRDLLYWNPEVTTDDGRCNMNFYTSDQTGKYVVVVNALSSDGKSASWSRSFNVIAPENN